MTVGAALEAAGEVLAAAGIETARSDAEWLLAHVTGLSRSKVAAGRRRELGDGEVDEYFQLVARRLGREPLAYVLGEWGFRRLTLKVDRRVLVPRPETEVVVERALALVREVPEPGVLDVGTGSGAIALAIADEHPGAHVAAIDVSADALDVARENARAVGLAVTFELRDAHDGLGGPYDLVVSNPPYVTAGEIEALQPEVRDWEPRLATVGQEHTAVIAEGATRALRPGGWLVLEVADGRGEEVAGLLRELGYEDVRSSPDLAGRDRVVEGRWTR